MLSSHIADNKGMLLNSKEKFRFYLFSSKKLRLEWNQNKEIMQKKMIESFHI